MSESDRYRQRDLIAVLRRVRRRLRLGRALEAAVLGGTVALAVAATLAVAHAARPAEALGGGPWVALPLGRRLLALLAAAALGAGIGALLVLARRVPSELAMAAAAIDRWLGRQPGSAGGHGDRARVALALGEVDSPFARAAVADAAQRVGTVPIREAAPLRRPRRLGALVIAAACGALAVALPVVAPTAATRGRSGAAARLGSAPALAAAMAEVEAIRQAARERGDDELAALAGELQGWLARAAEGAGAKREDLTNALANLAARARRAAQDGAQSAAVLARVAAALDTAEAARGLGQAFARLDAAAIAAEARAAGAATNTTAALAEALARAAAAARPDPRTDRPRRLDGLEPDGTPKRPGTGVDPRAAAGAPAGGPPERRLRRLERDLQETADACAVDPARCAREMDARSNDLAAPARDAAGAGARERLARAAESLRGAMGGAAPGQRGEPGTNRPGALGRGADQGPGQRAGGVATGQGDSSGPGESSGMSDSSGQAGRADDAASAAAREAFERDARGASAIGSGPGSAGAGDGIGAGEGAGATAGEGQRPPGTPAGGPRVELSIPEGAGPRRSEAIRTGAGRGFTQPGYAPVFRDYQAAMEDGLEGNDIPPERRQLVRRYFELIRPR